MSEKTHQPTAQKLREARRKGQIPKSKLLSSAAVTLGGLLGTLAFADATAARLHRFTASILGLTSAPDEALYEGLGLFARAAAPTLAGALTAAALSQVALAGFQLDASHVMPKFERLNFVEGAKKLFSVQKIIELGKGLMVTVVLAFVVWRGVVDAAPVGLRAISAEGGPALWALLALWRPLVFKAALVLAALGLGDQILARRKHIKDLMMSHEEVKQEHKNSEGDPHQKSKRKSLHKQLAAGGSARGVQKATAVVVNPTHVAVALRYDEGECDAPYIVAKGREEDALKLRKQAETLEIPVVRDIPLARALVQYDVGDEVPEELYQAAAAVLKVALEGSHEKDAIHALIDREEAP
jgi:type III secretion protein U